MRLSRRGMDISPPYCTPDGGIAVTACIKRGSPAWWSLVLKALWQVRVSFSINYPR